MPKAGDSQTSTGLERFTWSAALASAKAALPGAAAEARVRKAASALEVVDLALEPPEEFTDATGICIQPAPEDRKGARRPCNRGHFFVVLADRDHVFFEDRRHHRSEPVCDMFRGFTGFIKADAHSVYDAIFCGQALRDGSSAEPPKEVGCWSHARRSCWECATISKERDARAALLRIARMFEEEQKWDDLAPKARRRARERTLRPLVDELVT